jgi:hypothetical protein
VEERHGKFTKGEKVRFGLSVFGVLSRFSAFRYANMDFVIFYGLASCVIALLVFLYDITCQWHWNLAKRISELPEELHLSPKQLQAAQFVVPKFHLCTHGLKCQSRFSFNFLPNMGHTDGEDPERWWAHINPVSMSTKEMGLGAWLDTIDDHMCAWNWRKITGFGMFTAGLWAPI